MCPGKAGPPASSISSLFNSGVAHHQAGRLAEAGKVYQQVLASMPNHVDAKHLLGVVALQSGRLDEAQKLISEAIALNPKFASAHNNLGNVHLRQNRFEEAHAAFQRAVDLQPGFGDAHFNLANRLRAQGQLDDAIKHFRRAVAANPKWVQGHNNLGAALLESGEAREAAKALGAAVKLDPRHGDALNNLAIALGRSGEPERALSLLDDALKLDPESTMALGARGSILGQLGRFAEARQALERVLAVDPRSASAHSNLGSVLRDSGAPAEALEHFRQAIRIDPQLVEAQIGVSLALRDMGREGEARDHARKLSSRHPASTAALVFESTQRLELGDTQGAASALREAIEIRGSNAEAHYLLGNVLLMRQLRWSEAIASYQRALAADASHASARWALAMGQIPPIATDEATVMKSRANFSRMLGDLEKTMKPSTGAQGPAVVGSTQPFYLAYHAIDNRPLLARYGALCARLMADWQRQQVPASVPRASGPLRIGIASAHVSNHSVWNAIVKGWVMHLDRKRFEVHLFNLGAKDDEETAQARGWSQRLETGRHDVRQWATMIAGSGLDVLIYPEIGMDPLTAKLASLRLAPVQAASWGHPETSGLPTIDYYISAEGLEPPDAAAHYTERLAMLPHLGVYYQPLAPVTVMPDPAALGLPPDVPLLLCPGTPFKYSPTTDTVWVEIARRTRPSRLVFFHPSDPQASHALEERLQSRFKRAGLPFAECVRFIPTLDRARFYGLMRRAAVVLDTIGFSGFNTVMQAVECGVPVVTREGEFMRGRLGSGILRRMGIDALVAGSDAAYIDTAAALAHDLSRREQVRAEIVARRSVLYGDLEPVRALERFLEAVARPAAGGAH